MKNLKLLATVSALLLLTNCAQQQLDDADRAILNEIRNIAEDARENAAKAAQEASLAKTAAEEAAQDAADAALEAKSASEKANRIFLRSSEK